MAVWEEVPESSDSTASPDSSTPAKSSTSANTTAHTSTGKTDSRSAKTTDSSARTSGTPETGDPIQPSLLAGRMALSGAGIVVLALLSRRKAD